MSLALDVDDKNVMPSSKASRSGPQGRCVTVSPDSQERFMCQGMECEHEVFEAIISLGIARVLYALGILLCFVGLVSSGWAQIASSGLTGTVSDSSGHGLAGVEVTAVQDATGLQRKAISSAEGAYYFPKLPVGTYTVTFDHANFQSQRFDDVVQKLR